MAWTSSDQSRLDRAFESRVGDGRVHGILWMEAKSRDRTKETMVETIIARDRYLQENQTINHGAISGFRNHPQ